MKHTRKILLGSLILLGLQFAGIGCVGYVGGGGGGAVVYGPDVWVHDDVWLDGGGRGSYRGHEGAYIHPDGGGRHR